MVQPMFLTVCFYCCLLHCFSLRHTGPIPLVVKPNSLLVDQGPAMARGTIVPPSHSAEINVQIMDHQIFSFYIKQPKPDGRNVWPLSGNIICIPNR